VNPPAHAAFTENQASVVLAPSLVVTDSNAGASIVSATVALSGGTFAGDGDILAVNGAVGNLFINGANTITVSYDAGTETLTLTGSDTLADYQSALDNVLFTTASDNPTLFGSDPTRTVTWTITDSATSNNTGSATSTIDITAVNDAPTVTAADPRVSFTQGATTALSPTPTVSDVDNINLAGATVAITAGAFAGAGDILSATATGNITVSYDSANEVLTLTGTDTVANYQTVLDSVSFASGDNPDD